MPAIDRRDRAARRRGRLAVAVLAAAPAWPVLAPAPASRGGLDVWTYLQVSANHARVFGLAFADVQGDGWPDILSGPYWYRSPGGDLTGAWVQRPLPALDGGPADVLAAVDVDGDANFDAIAMSGTAGRVYWLERAQATGAWTATLVGDVGVSNHGISSQGYRVADLEPGGRPEIVINADPCYYFRIPANPAAGSWPRVRAIAPAFTADEEVAVGDIDRDGRLDLVATNGDTGEVRWFENPGDGSADWTPYRIATLPGIVFHDRVEVARLNADARLDIVVSEENGGASGAETWWLRQPADPTNPSWPATLLVSQASTNSMRIADLDHDGDMDIVTGEHFGDLEVTVWANDGSGVFAPHPVDSGHESHFGVKPFDLDRDGDLDLVSIAWNAPEQIHLWRNDSAPGQGFALFVDGVESGNTGAWSATQP